MIGGDGNTIAVFTYAHDYLYSRYEVIIPVSGAGSISANTVEPTSFIAVIHEMSVSLQHEAPICWRDSPPPCERNITIGWKRSRARRPRSLGDLALKQLHYFRDFDRALAEDGFSGQIFKYF